MKKLVLVVIDAMKPEMLDRAIAAGRAPALAADRAGGRLRERRGRRVPVRHARLRGDDHDRRRSRTAPDPEHELVPPGRGALCRVRLELLGDASVRGGAVADRHGLPDERRAPVKRHADRVRVARRPRRAHRRHHLSDLPRPPPARCGAGVGAGAAWSPRRSSGARSSGPQELFYADLYASRRTGCRGQLGMPGVRDQHTGCVGSYLVEHDLFDFLLFSLPDNDAWSHRNGPHAQVTSIAAADRQIERLMHAGGGPERFLEDHAVVVTSDHSQALVEERIRLDLALADFHVATPSASAIGRRGAGAEPGAALGDDLRARPRSPRGAGAARARGGRRARGRRPDDVAARARTAMRPRR